MAVKNGKRQGGKVVMDEVLAGTTGKVLKRIKDLYDTGYTEEGEPSSASYGLKAIAESPQLQLQVRRPRKKITVMIIGNHSAGKSSFINWYIGDDIQKTGVAIETRGFTFVTCGKKRETLTGESTLKYFDYLEGFGKFPGIMANLFTEVSTSKEKSFSCVDLIDTPGLVDGDMQYPFDVQDSILWLAEHADLIMIFFDPIGQATCKRTLQVVERLNNSPHVEKIHYFMSKADAVEREHDRQRVLIQITYNLATRLRNSHAFKLPTFYLPKEDNPDCPIPNAIQEVCMEIDKAINMGVQRNLKTLQEDCSTIQERIVQVQEQDQQHRKVNTQRRLQGIFYSFLTSLAFTAMLLVTALRAVPFTCHVLKPAVCELALVKRLSDYEEHLAANFRLLFWVTLGVTVIFWTLAKWTWRIKPVFSKKDMQRLAEYRQHVQDIADQEKELYDQYFKSLKLLDDQ